MGFIGSILGLYWGNMGIMEKKMETTMVYWGNMGIMENQMENTIGDILGIIRP